MPRLGLGLNRFQHRVLSLRCRAEALFHQLDAVGFFEVECCDRGNNTGAQTIEATRFRVRQRGLVADRSRGAIEALDARVWATASTHAWTQ